MRTTDVATTSGPTGLERLGAPGGVALRAFPGQAPLAALLTVLVLAGGVVSGIWCFRTGEAGARSVWADTPTASAGGR